MMSWALTNRWIEVKNIIKLCVSVITGNKYFVYRLYSRRGSTTSTIGIFDKKSIEKFSIVLQGSVLDADYFTIETCKLYRQLFPDALVILSTWKISDVLKNNLLDIGVYWIENEAPENPGIANINMQITTSREGVLLAKNLGANYVLKTRTDQRIYHPSLYAYLRNLLNLFPLKNINTRQHERLIGISMNTLKFRMYGLSDMFLFGQIDDMILYWNTPLDPRYDTSEERSNVGKTWKESAIWGIGETYLCTAFLRKIGYEIQYTLADSFNAISKHFIVIDAEAIRLYWNKYTFNADRYSAFGFFNPEISFNDWLMLYENIETIDIDYSIIDQPISQ